MLFGLFVLLLSQLGGEIIVRGLGLPIPGPVVGIVLLLIGLAVHARLTNPRNEDRETAVGRSADGLLRNLGLVFVPAGVGISQNYQLVFSNGLALIAALVGSTVLTLVVTMAVFRFVAARVGGEVQP